MSTRRSIRRRETEGEGGREEGFVGEREGRGTRESNRGDKLLEVFLLIPWLKDLDWIGARDDEAKG